MTALASPVQPILWNGPVCPKHGPYLNYCAGCSDAADAERLPTVWSQDRARSELRVGEMLDEDGSWKV